MSYLLEPVGLGEVDNRVFLALFDAPRSSAADLAADLGIPIAATRRALERLVSVGLATKVVSRPVRYLPSQPEVAVDALVAQRQRDLRGLQEQARELAARLGTGANRAADDLVEVVEGVDAVQRVLGRLQLGARDEVLLVDAPPYLTGAPARNDEELLALARSVRYRCVYHAPSLQSPTHFALMMECVRAGEQARALPSTPMKMLIADHRAAMLPMTFDTTDATTRLLVHPSPLLDALVVCFESLWNQATPLADPDPRPELSEKDRQLLALLAAGAKDRAIARTLNVTERTVGRRIAELMTALSAETRFQAGLQAARRGWL